MFKIIDFGSQTVRKLTIKVNVNQGLFRHRSSFNIRWNFSLNSAEKGHNFKIIIAYTQNPVTLLEYQNVRLKNYFYQTNCSLVNWK